MRSWTFHLPLLVAEGLNDCAFNTSRDEYSPEGLVGMGEGGTDQEVPAEDGWGKVGAREAGWFS